MSPTAPPSVCRHCPKRTTNPGSVCDSCKKEEHKRYNQFSRDKDQAAYYKTREWKAKRVRIITRAGGMCEAILSDKKRCNSIVRIEVDHRIPRTQGGSDDDDNLQALCKSCHSAKTKRENR